MTIEEEIAEAMIGVQSSDGRGWFIFGDNEEDRADALVLAKSLAPILNRVRAEAIRDATRVFAEGGWIDTFTADVVDDVTAVQAADRWFTAHAATIEQNRQEREGNET